MYPHWTAERSTQAFWVWLKTASGIVAHLRRTPTRCWPIVARWVWSQDNNCGVALVLCDLWIYAAGRLPAFPNPSHRMIGGRAHPWLVFAGHAGRPDLRPDRRGLHDNVGKRLRVGWPAALPRTDRHFRRNRRSLEPQVHMRDTTCGRHGARIHDATRWHSRLRPSLSPP